MNHLMTLLALVVTVTAGAQLEPVGDLNEDGLVGVEDLMALLGVFGNNYNELNAHPDCVPVEYHGYTYDVIQIGSQCWFAENLRTEFDRNGNPIPYIDNLAEWAAMEEDFPFMAQTIYEFNDSLLAIHGRLYTWGASMIACPTGWNSYSDEMWFLLETEAGLPVTWAAREGSRGLGSGCGTNLLDESVNGTNALGFNSLLSGGILCLPEDSIAHFYGLDTWTAFWTTSASGNLCGYSGEMYIGGGVARQLFHPQFHDGSFRKGYFPKTGHSVRCSKDLGEW